MVYNLLLNSMTEIDKLAQEESGDPPISNRIESWLSEQEDVVRRPESMGSRSETPSHVSCAHHFSCRKEIAQLRSENEAIKINQERLFSFFAMGRTFARPQIPQGIRQWDLHVPMPMQRLKLFHSRQQQIPERKNRERPGQS